MRGVLEIRYSDVEDYYVIVEKGAKAFLTEILRDTLKYTLENEEILPLDPEGIYEEMQEKYTIELLDKWPDIKFNYYVLVDIENKEIIASPDILIDVAKILHPGENALHALLIITVKLALHGITLSFW